MSKYFDSIEGVAAAKRELIEALPPDGVAVLNADDPLVSGFGAVHRGRTIRFGFSADADVRAEHVGTNPGWRAFPRERRAVSRPACTGGIRS